MLIFDFLKGTEEYACAFSIAIFSVKMYILYVYIWADSSFFYSSVYKYSLQALLHLLPTKPSQLQELLVMVPFFFNGSIFWLSQVIGQALGMYYLY